MHTLPKKQVLSIPSEDQEFQPNDKPHDSWLIAKAHRTIEARYKPSAAQDPCPYFCGIVANSWVRFNAPDEMRSSDELR